MGTKDHPTQQFWLGISLPVMLIALVTLNAVTGQAWWPNGRAPGIVDVYRDAWRVVGTMLLELGFAAALFSWFLLANHDRYARLVGPGILLGIVAIIVGLALFVAGFF